jgi:superfamily II DNA helicase RecQ
VTPLGHRVLAGRAEQDVRVAAQPSPRPTSRTAATAPANGALFERLRQWRAEAARAAGVPAYVVFHDTTLAAIAAARPGSAAELADVPGVGPAKLERYGDGLLKVVAGATD